jgi:hypothetical protein
LIRARNVIAPVFCRVSGAESLAHKFHARDQRRPDGAKFIDIVARDAQHRQKPVECSLRMARGRIKTIGWIAGYQGEAVRIYIFVEAWQDDSAVSGP